MDLAKAIPSSDASLEAREGMREARAARYPEVEEIPIQTGFGSLSAGEDDPLDEDLWGDPVNLAYPLAYRGDTEPDRTRSNNARARFKQFASGYSRRSSRAFVHERIVRAQIQSGSVPGFDPSDPLDALLPTNLTREMQALKGSEIYMNKTKNALERFRSMIAGADPAPARPSPREALEKASGIIASLSGDQSWRAEVLDLLEIAKSVVHSDSTGEPESLGLTVNDHSREPNFTPVELASVVEPEDRVLDGAIDQLTVEEATELTQNPAPNPDLPATGPTPGPRVPAPLPSTGDVTMPPAFPSSTTGREVEGVTKRTLEDAFDTALSE